MGKLQFNNTRKPNFKEIQAIDYNQYWAARGFTINTTLKEREKIILNLIEPQKKVMDIGCGNSLLPIKLKEKNCMVTVGDLSDKVIEGYRAYGIDGHVIDLEKGEISGSYDCLILSEVLEHLKNPEEAIIALKKHTRQFFITVPNSAFYRYRFHLMFSGRFFTQWVYHPSEHLRFWSHLDFLDWLDAMGLTVTHCESSNGFSLFGFFPQLKNIWKNMCGHQIVYVCQNKSLV